MGPIFEWDLAKASLNERKHGIPFELAQRIFSDPFLLIEQDRIEGNEYRWRATGRIGGIPVLVVAHSYPDGQDDVIRIISAREATPKERRAYDQHLRSQQL